MANIKLNQEALKPRRELKRHQIQPGHNIFRILPPFGDESVHNNYPYKRWSLVWMVDPQSGRRKPFALPPFEKDNPDPISKYIKLLTEKIDRAKKTAIDGLISRGVSQDKAEDMVREKLADANRLVWELRPKNGYFYNACNKAGEVGILELRKTAHDALKAAMYEYIKDYSQDPTSLYSNPDDSGVWFDIERIGEKGDKNTEYRVRKNQIKRKNEAGKLVFEDDQEPLTEHVVQNYNQLGYDIYNLYQTKTHEELFAALMFNLKDIVNQIPLARIEGFDPDKFDFAAVRASAPPSSGVTQPNKATVKLSGLTEEDVDFDFGVDEPAVKPSTSSPERAATAKAVSSQPEPSDEDIVAMAERFLNS